MLDQKDVVLYGYEILIPTSYSLPTHTISFLLTNNTLFFLGFYLFLHSPVLQGRQGPGLS